MSIAGSQALTPEKLAMMEDLLDRHGILECLRKVARGMDRFDRDLFLSAFHSDAIIDAGALVGTPAEVYEQATGLHAHGQSCTHHNLLNHSCEIDGDVAHAETYYLYVGRNRDETNWAAGGRYIDRVEQRQGTWKIALRCTVVEWSGMIPSTVVPLFENVPDLHLNGEPSRSREDLSYRRPLINKRPMTSPADVRELSTPRH
jgi:hypothetical protein